MAVPNYMKVLAGVQTDAAFFAWRKEAILRHYINMPVFVELFNLKEKSMKPSMDDVKLLIKQHEGYCGEVYADSVGVLTCGYGHALHPGSQVSGEIADLFFASDFDHAVLLVNLFIQRYELEHLNSVRVAILTDMMFNLGPSRLRKFKRFIDAMQREAYEIAAEEMLDSKWARQVGRRADKLAAMMHTGVWSTTPI